MVGLEFTIHEEPDGRRFLNFWDCNCNEYSCEIIDGELIRHLYDDEGNELEKKQIQLTDLVKLIEFVIKCE